MENSAVNFFLYIIIVLKVDPQNNDVIVIIGVYVPTSVVHCLCGGRERAELIPMPA